MIARKKKIATFGLLGSLGASLVAATILAQDNQLQPRTFEVAKPVIGASPMAGIQTADRQLAACLIVDNQGEIALGKLAEQRAKDQEVKQFGEKMVKDHSDFMQQLEKFVGTGGERANVRPDNRMPGAEAATQTSPQGTTDRALPGTSAQPMGSQSLDFVALKQQIGQKCLEMEKHALEEKEGSQFDKCYIGGQIGAHMHVLATLEVVRNQASPELAAVLDKGIETTKTHLDHAEKIAKALDQQ